MRPAAELFPPLSVEPVDRVEADRLLSEWDHPLGPCNRPFGQDHHVLLVRGRAVALTVTASTVSPTIRDANDVTWPRNAIVELARITRHPDERWAMRPMLRLWREVLAHEWTHWPVHLAASYALPGTTGNLYRFDGWTRVRTVKKSSTGKSSTWGKPSASDAIADGRKTLWIFRYRAALSADAALSTSTTGEQHG